LVLLDLHAAACFCILSPLNISHLVLELYRFHCSDVLLTLLLAAAAVMVAHCWRQLWRKRSAAGRSDT
jgi:hypothetical protein